MIPVLHARSHPLHSFPPHSTPPPPLSPLCFVPALRRPSPGNRLRPGAGRGPRAGSSPASTTPSPTLCWPPPGSLPWPAVEAANGRDFADEDYLHICALWAAARPQASPGCAAVGRRLARSSLAQTTFTSTLDGSPPGSRHGAAVGRLQAGCSMARITSESVPCQPPSGG
jgi:hypothetical protein